MANRARILVAMLAMSVVVSACGGDDGGAAGGGGGGDCAEVCAAYKAAGCGAVTDLSEPDCVTECRSTDALVADGAHTEPCQDEWQAYKECVTGASLGCRGIDVDKGACRVHYDHYYNYCMGLSTPADPCLANAAWDAFCAPTPATPKGKVCRGEPESGCVMGGNDGNADLYCCP